MQDMKFFLCQLTINGCRSINKPIVMKFYNSVVKPNVNLDDTNVKAIFGSNGSGKTAIVAAMAIYKNVVLFKDKLADPAFCKFIIDNINKKDKELFIEPVFAAYSSKNNKTIDVISHSMILKAGEDGLVRISSEKIGCLIGNSIAKGRFKTCIEYKDGQTNNDFSNKDKVIEGLRYVKLFANNLEVYMNNQLSSDCSCLNNSVEKPMFSFEANKADKVLKADYPAYKKEVERLVEFLRVFKHNLVDIDIETKEDKGYIYCSKILNYCEYRLNIELESTGIKKLVELFYLILACSTGKIVFIDDLDANIHDVYFTKLVDFFCLYSEGQMCFTAHETNSIDVLKEYKYSLDFLSDDSTLTRWKKCGHNSPKFMYANGLVEGSPFNVQPSDFIEPFFKGE